MLMFILSLLLLLFYFQSSIGQVFCVGSSALFQYAKVQSSKHGQVVEFAQLAVYDSIGINNIALHRPTNATESNKTGNFIASNAVNGDLRARSAVIYVSVNNDPSPFWEVNFNQPTSVSRVEFFSRLPLNGIRYNISLGVYNNQFEKTICVLQTNPLFSGQYFFITCNNYHEIKSFH